MYIYIHIPYNMCIYILIHILYNARILTCSESESLWVSVHRFRASGQMYTVAGKSTMFNHDYSIIIDEHLHSPNISQAKFDFCVSICSTSQTSQTSHKTTKKHKMSFDVVQKDPPGCWHCTFCNTCTSSVGDKFQNSWVSVSLTIVTMSLNSE